MISEEITLKKETVYRGKLISVEHHDVRLQNGKTATRDVVRHPGAVAILATTPEDKVILVKQYRKGIEQVTLEIPAGKLDHVGESPIDAAKRELIEETGYKAQTWQKLIDLAVSPAYVSEYISIYEAGQLEPLVDEAYQLDEDEFVEVLEVSQDDVNTLLASGAISDAKTLYALTHWLLMKERAHVN